MPASNTANKHHTDRVQDITFVIKSWKTEVVRKMKCGPIQLESVSATRLPSSEASIISEVIPKEGLRAVGHRDSQDF